jgi:hypothetical protein
MLKLVLACIGAIGFGACTAYERPMSAFDVTQYAYVTGQNVRIAKVGHVHRVPVLQVPIRHPFVHPVAGRATVRVVKRCPELVVC